MPRVDQPNATLLVALEITSRRTFASAIEWPGLARSGKTEAAALDALLASVHRYAGVAGNAGEVLPAGDLALSVVESAPGNASTEFGVPGRITDADRRPTSIPEADRLVRLVSAAWAYLDATVASARGPLSLGPRGGGRDVPKIVEHTLAADHAYGHELGLRLPRPDPSDETSIRALREAILEVIHRPSDGLPIAGRKWTTRYAAHRIAWHALDHAWEIQDRSRPAG